MRIVSFAVDDPDLPDLVRSSRIWTDSCERMRSAVAESDRRALEEDIEAYFRAWDVLEVGERKILICRTDAARFNA